MSSRWLLAVAFFLSATAACMAQGGPPMRSDDPGTPGSGNLEVNIAATADRRPDERVYETPLLDFNYGLGERMQVKFEIPWIVQTSNTEPTKNGLGNSLIGFKYRFLENKKHEVEMSVYPQCEFNNPNRSADRGLVDRGVRFLIPVEATKPIGPVNFNGELGYTITQFGPNEWIAGLAAGRQVRPRLELLGEIYATGTVDGAEHDISLDFGGRFKIRERLLLLFMAGHSFSEAGAGGSHLVGYLGMQFVLPTSKHTGKVPAGAPEPR
jgi:Putative MetA-pathway of phenol degradation